MSRPTSVLSRSSIRFGVVSVASVTRAPCVLGVLEHPRAVPPRDEVERVGIGVLDARPLDVRVEVVDVDELRAAAVAGGGDRARDVLVADLAGDHQHLPRLHVRAVHGELREPFQTIGHRQAMLRATANLVP